MRDRLALVVVVVTLGTVLGALTAGEGGAVVGASLAVLVSLTFGTRYVAPGHRPTLRRTWRRAPHVDPRLGEGVPTFRTVYDRLGWSEVSGRDHDDVVRPLLVELAESRLAARGVSLSRQPDEARRLLGDEAFALVAPREDLDDSGHRTPSAAAGRTPGVPLARVARLIDRLEQL